MRTAGNSAPAARRFYNDANGDLQGLFAGTLDVPTTLKNWQKEAKPASTGRRRRDPGGFTDK